MSEVSNNRVIHLTRQVYRNAIGFAGLRRSDVWLSSYPRSGNSWFRAILGNLIYLSETPEEEIDWRTLYDLMPVMGFSNLLKPWEHTVIPRMVKTHQPYRPQFFGRPERTLLLLRDPRDVMLSYYNMRTSAKLNRFTGSFSEFIRHPSYGLPGWMRHYSTWLPRATVLMIYEEFRSDTCATIRRTFHALGHEIPEDLLLAAIERSTIERMREKEAVQGIRDADRFDASFNAVRTGASKQWIDTFSESDLTYYHQLREQHGVDRYA
jgi:estrone sulfotransferase